jgi:hypothetical protein
VKGLLDLADIDDRLAAGEALREAPPDRERQASPFFIREQRVKPMIVEQYFRRACDTG